MKVLFVKRVWLMHDCAVCDKQTNIRVSESGVRVDTYLCEEHLAIWESQYLFKAIKIKYKKDI